MKMSSESRIGFFRRVLTGGAGSSGGGFDREEQGMPPVGGGHGSGEPKRRLTVTDASTLVPLEDKLLTFRSLTGIDTVPALTTGAHAARSAPNVGIYTRVIQAESKAALKYKTFSILVNVCLATQIIVSACVTAVGAAKGSYQAVTAFGAIGTIMAGILTYLRGSGMPNRLKLDEEEWRHIREYIEQREREFCLVNCPLDVTEEIQIVEDMYHQTKSRLEEGHGESQTGGRGHDDGGGSSRRNPSVARRSRNLSTPNEPRLRAPPVD